MVRRSRSRLAADVDGLRHRMDHWRRTRARRSPMPGQLWDAAVALARAQGVYPVARRFGLNYESLKRRVVRRASGRRASEGASGSFVELAPRLPFGLATTPAGAVVEFTNQAGDKLAIHLGGGGDIDVMGLAAAFWSRRP